MRRKYRRELTIRSVRGEDVKKADEKIKDVLLRIKRDCTALIDAVNYLIPTPVEEIINCLCTDGRRLFYHTEYVLGSSADNLYEAVLHILFHGILGHFEKGSSYENLKLSWDIMDLEVLRLFIEVGKEPYRWCDWKNELWELFQNETGFSLYYKAQKDLGLQKRIRKIISRMKALMPGFLDDHSTWALPKLKVELKEISEEELKEMQQQSGWRNITIAIIGGDAADAANKLPRELMNAIARALKGSWSASRGGFWGMESEEVTAKDAVREYKNILEDLRTLIEVSGEEDEIDPAIYEYGLMLYGDVPLVEPMENKMTHHISNIVLAVDTSGSCTEFMESFWSESMEIFRELEEFGEIGKLIYLECDAEIVSEQVYDSVEDLKGEFGNSHCFTGFGGTDFRPVFDKISEYENNGESIDFLIYFSDGMGDYPDVPTKYPTYFVFPNSEYLKATTEYRPDWIKTLVLETDD